MLADFALWRRALASCASAFGSSEGLTRTDPTIDWFVLRTAGTTRLVVDGLEESQRAGKHCLARYRRKPATSGRSDTPESMFLVCARAAASER